MSEISSGLVKHIAEFKVALNGAKGDLDAWLECNNEAEVKAAINGLVAEKDAEILEQCRINGMGAEREAALLGKVAQQSAALKLAMEALVTARDTFTRYSLHHEAKGDFEKAQANKAFADSLKKAIAAIDAALKGE